MTINNPLADNSPDHADQNLVLRARSGDRQALEDLVQRHQAWIYNIAVRMLHHPQDAEDVTQEILIKVLTRLSSFEGRSSFRTWLYRIVVNHVLNMKRGRVEVRHASIDFASYGAALDDTPYLDLADLKATSAETDLLVTEEMLSCTLGMLLCLDREPGEPLPVCQEDAWLHRGRLRRSREFVVRPRTNRRGAGSRTEGT
jgi:RNA polymerase sigma factor (sigma-70 family)